MGAAHLGSAESLKSLLKPEQQDEMGVIKSSLRMLVLIKSYASGGDVKERETQRVIQHSKVLKRHL